MWNWKVQYLLIVLTDPSGLSPQPTRNPAGEPGLTNGWWYDASTGVALTAQSVTNYAFDRWDVDGGYQAGGVNPITVTVSASHTTVAHYEVLAPPLSVSITPPSATIYLGQSVAFTSTLNGGTTPYSYQWYANDNPVSGATSSTWAFTPSATGVYYVYLKVTDANNNNAQSSTARINVISVPVGGYSVPLTEHVPAIHLASYFMVVALFGAILSLKKRKRK
jgi:hypothetical protein